MPEILIASGDGFDTRGALVDSEVECGSAVATLRVERIGLAIPCVAVASGDSLDAGVAMIDGEVECSSAVATLRIER